MIQILPLDGTPPQYFESFKELFVELTTAGNSKLLDDQYDFVRLDWSFTVYPPKRVVVLHAHTKVPCGAMQEAVEDNLPLIEICAGDYKNPQYIVLTANVDMDYLKKKWCIDYCTFHHVLVKEV
ncbi:MAG: hypothetical protein FJX71_06990 [Alphaproteobacteria bacterium]|nr:hypothetical protein [Alphaproteobacteria bacterium]